MANNNNLNLHVFTILKGNINIKTLIPMIDIDADFSENEEYYRDNTLIMGYKSESERVSKEIYEQKYNSDKEEKELLSCLVESIFEINNFILNDKGTFEITELLDTYIISIAYIY